MTMVSNTRWKKISFVLFCTLVIVTFLLMENVKKYKAYDKTMLNAQQSFGEISNLIETVRYPTDDQEVDIKNSSENIFNDFGPIDAPGKQDDETIDDTLTEQLPQDDLNITRDKARSKYNVLFLMTDDMRVQIGPYMGQPDSTFTDPVVYTPNLDKLASRSLVLRKAFVQYALCGPSRTSMLTSRYPDATGVTDNKKYWRIHYANITTLPEYFKEQGYKIIGAGKIFHDGPASGDQDPQSWSDTFNHFENTDGFYMADYNLYDRWRAVTENETSEVPLMDMVTTNLTVKLLKELAPKGITGEEPFFLGLGFKKPHASQVCPQKFFEMYPLDIEKEFISQEELEAIGVGPDKLKLYRRAYLACISYVDSLIGDVMKALDETGLWDSTIISFVSDHGYHYGEHGWFGKSRNYDAAARVPMMIHIPEKTDSGIVTNSIVEAIDLFPTLVEAAGLKMVPSCPQKSENITKLCTQGVSFMPLVDNPNAEIKQQAFSQRTGNRMGTRMHYSIRTPQYRLSTWAEIEYENQTVYIEPVEWVEFYDHATDPKEYNNLGIEYANLTKELYDKLHTHILDTFRG